LPKKNERDTEVEKYAGIVFLTGNTQRFQKLNPLLQKEKETDGL
jgi:hypothetical protein